jgi:hypothetical protein
MPMDLNKNLIKRSLLEVFNIYDYGRDGLELIKRIGILREVSDITPF